MADEPLTADSPEYRAIVERAKANRELLTREANGAGAGTLDAAQIAAIRRRLGPTKIAQVNLIATCVGEATQPLFRAIKTLHERIAELEKKPTLEYCGVWTATNTYGKGCVVTHHGSAWHCNHQETSDEPGKSDAFTLMVKRGKDAR